MRRVDDEKFDSQRVDEFFSEFMKRTGHLLPHLEKRTQELDNRIRNANLSLADKIEVFKRLSPRAEDGRLGAITGERKELRMERLLRSVAPEDLSAFKFALEYDGDYKDLEEYIFHDIDDRTRQTRIIEYLGRTPQQIGIKVLSDVDDTMYANLVENRYPKKTTLYPGVLEFYDALKQEPFELQAIPVTTLSARPNPIAGSLEEASLKSLVKFTNERLCPSALSGALVSATLGTVETVLRQGLKELDLLSDEIPHGKEAEIGIEKFKKFMNFAAVYPEYGYVFVGDSGQADALTAQRMLTTEGSSRVVTTFIHDLRQSEDDTMSPAFTDLLRSDVVITKTSDTGRGVIVFRNYIDAAVIAHTHSATLENLVTAEGLAKITRAALKQFQEISFEKKASKQRLREQYLQDAEEAYKRLKMETPTPSRLEEDVKEIRRILDEEF